jgi:cytochrome c oxidase subunit 2
VTLQTGQTVPVNLEYVRESILQPHSKMVAGYTAIMPTYQGQISEADLLNLISYIKSIGKTGSD